MRWVVIIRKKASDIAKSSEHLGEEIPLPKGSELSELVESFNEMSINLRNSHDHLEGQVKERTADLENSNHKLTKEISEHKRAEKQLIQAKKELEETNEHLIEATARANDMASEAEIANICKSQFLVV